MKNLDDVIAGLSCCGSPNCGCACAKCPYDNERDSDKVCLDLLQEDALEYLKRMDDLRKDMWDLANENHRLVRLLKLMRTQRNSAWEKIARITGERYDEWLNEEVVDV